MIGRVARQDGDVGNELALRIGCQLDLVPVKPFCLALASVAHLRVVDRRHPVLGHSLPEGRPVLPPLDILPKHPAEQTGAFLQPLVCAASCLQPAPRLAHFR